MHGHATVAGTAATGCNAVTHRRVASITIARGAFKAKNIILRPPKTSLRSTIWSLLSRVVKTRASFEVTTDPVAVLWEVLDMCVPAERRARARLVSFSKYDIPTALLNIDVTFPQDPRANTPIIGPLTTRYPALVRSLRVLKIVDSRYDESAALGAFAALATHLQALTFVSCCLTSVRGLEGRCEYLRGVNLRGCRITNIDALADRVYLEEVNVMNTGVTTIEPLRTCPNLKTVSLYRCRLSSIDALAGHQRLQEVDVSFTGIPSIEPLLSCPQLTKVYLSDERGLGDDERDPYDCLHLPADVRLPATVSVHFR